MSQFTPSAKIIADSVSVDGDRITTMQVTGHRFILAEFNTHRVLSRNSASSRAIPLRKQLERIRADLAWPVTWPVEQKGMQGGEPLSAEDQHQVRNEWRMASEDAALAAERIGVKFGVHKSVANRLLEPFMQHTIVVTATAWDNFFALRTDADAQPEIRVLAEAMQAAYVESTPTQVRPFGWHLPYVDEQDWEAMRHRTALGENMTPQMCQVSAARCARVSYLTQEGKRDIEVDLGLYDRLVTDRVAASKPVHWSPLEHVATPWPANRQSQDLSFLDGTGETWGVPVGHLPVVGNLLGWRSLRTEVETKTGEVTYR